MNLDKMKKMISNAFSKEKENKLEEIFKEVEEYNKTKSISVAVDVCKKLLKFKEEFYDEEI